jgi:hypothetical protein
MLENFLVSPLQPILSILCFRGSSGQAACDRVENSAEFESKRDQRYNARCDARASRHLRAVQNLVVE